MPVWPVGPQTAFFCCCGSLLFSLPPPPFLFLNFPAQSSIYYPYPNCSSSLPVSLSAFLGTLALPPPCHPSSDSSFFLSLSFGATNPFWKCFFIFHSFLNACLFFLMTVFSHARQVLFFAKPSSSLYSILRSSLNSIMISSCISSAQAFFFFLWVLSGNTSYINSSYQVPT